MTARPSLLTVAEVAAELRVSRTCVYEQIRRGEIPTITVGRALRVPSRWLEERIDASMSKAAS